MFEIKDKFYLNGEPFQIVSGAFHYFRTVPEYWRDRLEKLKALGCNTVETYIPWNFHEPNRGEFIWDGMRDVCRFIETAQELGLYIIIRPSPYICAEWEFGGLPAWLLKDRGMRLRCSYEPYLKAVREYYEVLIPKLAPYQIDRGGNIILMQLENEYGYYGNDKAYMEFLRDTMRELGITVPFITSDGPWSESLFRSGMIDGALPTANFGSSVEWQFSVMKKIIGEDKPLMCTEFWVGWFDAWGDKERHKSDIEKNKVDLEELLKTGNLNFYMFEGGTNFGFMSGKNGGSPTCDVTSYDYDGILTEDGQITEKYNVFKEIIGKYREIPKVELSTKIARKEYGNIPCTGRIDLFSALGTLAEPIRSSYPLTMEEAGQNYGYILYRLKLPQNEAAADIRLENAADRVQAFQNGKYLFTAFGGNIGEKFDVPQKENGAVIDLLCENVGRENFGTGLESQRKGISGGVKINDHRHFGYEIFTLPLDEEQISKLDFSASSKAIPDNVPTFSRFELDVEELCDTFVDFGGFGKGCIFVNGFNLGRFWDSPQKRLYLPAPLLKKGRNTIIVFETEGTASDSLFLAGEPNLG
jgi:beta-galactosidase